MSANPRPTQTRFQPQQTVADLTSPHAIRVADVGQLMTVSTFLTNLARAVDQTRPWVREADKALRCGPYGSHALGHPDATRQTNHVDSIARRAHNVAVQVEASLVDLHRCLQDTAKAVERIAKSVNDGNRDNTERLKRLFDAEFGSARPGSTRSV